MLPTTVPTLSAYQGDDYTLTIPFKDEDDAPINVSGSTFEANLTYEHTDFTLPATLTWTIDDTDAATGILVLTLDGDALAEVPLDERNYVELRWDLSEAGLWDRTVLTGILRVIGEA